MSNELTIDRVEVGQALPELAIEVTPTTVVLGAVASRDWRPMHHDKDFAVERNGIAECNCSLDLATVENVPASCGTSPYWSQGPRS